MIRRLHALSCQIVSEPCWRARLSTSRAPRPRGTMTRCAIFARIRHVTTATPEFKPERTPTYTDRCVPLACTRDTGHAQRGLGAPTDGGRPVPPGAAHRAVSATDTDAHGGDVASPPAPPPTRGPAMDAQTILADMRDDDDAFAGPGTADTDTSQWRSLGFCSAERHRNRLLGFLISRSPP